MKYLALLLLPSLAFADCNLTNTHWIAKTPKSIHSFQFNESTVDILTISKEEAYFHNDLNNANAFKTTSTYNIQNCELVMVLPHEDGSKHQVFGFMTDSAGYGFYLNGKNEVVMEFSK